MVDEQKQELSTLDKAELLANRLEEQNKKFEELVQRQEKARAENLLGGKSISNQDPVKPKRELTPKEAAALFGKGVNLKDPMPLVDA